MIKLPRWIGFNAKMPEDHLSTENRQNWKISSTSILIVTATISVESTLHDAIKEEFLMHVCSVEWIRLADRHRLRRFLRLQSRDTVNIDWACIAQTKEDRLSSNLLNGWLGHQVLFNSHEQKTHNKWLYLATKICLLNFCGIYSLV